MLHGSFLRRIDKEDAYHGRCQRPAAALRLEPRPVHDSTLAGPLLDDYLPADGFMLANKARDAEWIKGIGQGSGCGAFHS